jgi:hypothetical protein
VWCRVAQLHNNNIRSHVFIEIFLKAVTRHGMFVFKIVLLIYGFAMSRVEKTRSC